MSKPQHKHTDDANKKLTEADKAAETAIKNENAAKAQFAKAAEGKDVKNIVKASEAYDSAVDASKSAIGAADAEKNFLTRQLKVTWAHKDKAIKAAEGNIDKLAKAEKLEIGALRKTKVGAVLAGAALITYGTVAALGNKGPGENAQRVREAQEPQVATGRA